MRMTFLSLWTARRRCARFLGGAAASALFVGSLTMGAPAEAQNFLALEDAPGAATARLLFLPEDLARLDDPVPPGERRIIVTGTYSSGEAYRPEGFTIRAGDPTRPYPQGWDGLLVIDAAGGASIHDVSRVEIDGRVYDLRERDSRSSFVERAAAEQLSVVQSHLLINDGALDLREVDGAPIARRRVLFQTPDGRIGIYDSAPYLLTLYDAAVEVQNAVGPNMALNLDMGTYDFCEIRTTDAAERCGALGRRQVEGRLTNLIEISITAPAGN